MNKLGASSIAIGLFLITGCAASGPKMASSAEDVAGTWQSTVDGLEVQFNEDGTLLAEIRSDHAHAGEFRFEGTRLFLKELEQGSVCVGGAETGIYEIELLENGNLKFTAIEDECATRVSYLEGALIEAEWEPVP